VPSVAIRKRMYLYQPMVEANSDFILRIRVVLNPVFCVTQQNRQLFTNPMNRHTNVLLGSSILPRPFPGLVKHFEMQLSDVSIRKHFSRRRPVTLRPFTPLNDIFSFPFI